MTYKGVVIAVEDPRTVLAQKVAHAKEHGIPLSAKHRHDLTLFGVEA